MLLNCWILVSGVFGALNLRSIIIYSRKRDMMESDIKAKETKIIMLEAKILYLETQQSYEFNGGSGNTK